MRPCLSQSLRLLSAAIPLLAAGGCAHYVAKPLEPAKTLETLRERRLSDPQVLARLRAATGSPYADGVARWGRTELLAAAIELNPRLGEARATLDQVTAGKRTAKALQNPSVSLATEYDLSRVGEPATLWGIGTSFLLDTFTARHQRIALADAAVRGANADFRDAMWTARRDLRAALLSVIVADRRVALLEGDRKQRGDLARLASDRIEAGESARLEGLQTSLEYERSRAALEDALSVRVDARSKLAAALGVTRGALDGVELEWDDIDSVGPIAADSLAKAREYALLSRPDLERAIADYSARELDLRQQMGAQYLQASFGPGYTWDHGIRKVTFGASLSLPVFNHNQGPIAEAMAARESAGQHALAVQGGILNEIEAAEDAYRNALESLARTRAQRAASERLASNVRQEFDVEAADRPTLLTAESAASTERIAELDALDRAQQALGLLEDAVRTPLSGPELKLMESR